MVLTFDRWRHISEQHPELAFARDAILAAVAEPIAHRAAPEPDQEWFYGRDFGPSRLVRVVVHFRGGAGSITTAFPRRRFP